MERVEEKQLEEGKLQAYKQVRKWVESFEDFKEKDWLLIELDRRVKQLYFVNYDRYRYEGRSL